MASGDGSGHAATTRDAGRFAIAILVLLLLAGSSAAAPGGGGKGRKDGTPPSIVIVAPTAGATVSGTVTVTGTAADNVQVAAVTVSVDNGPFAAASGTTSWSYGLDTTSLTAGAHTISARATDSSGNSTVSSVSVSVKAAADTTPPTVSITAP